MFIAALRALVVCSMLSGCGGGGGGSGPIEAQPVPVQVQADLLDYAPWFKPWQGTFTGGIWTARPVDAMRSNLWWSTNYYEVFQLAVNPKDGREWVWLCAYGDPPAHREYPLTVRSVVLVFGDGTREDVTPPAPLACQLYMLRYPPLFYVVIAQGDVHADPDSCKTDGTCGHLTQFFHQAEYTGPVEVLNSGWLGDAVITRKAFRQREAYWDNNPTGRIGWGTGSGSIGADGLPDGVQVVYGREQTIALGAGFAWTQVTYADPANPNARAGSFGHLLNSQPI